MPRELRGLAFIAEAQPVQTRACQQLLCVSPAVARRSLRKMKDLGLVNVHVLAMEVPSRYTITARGRALLAQELDRPPEELRVPRGISKISLAHHDGSVDLFIALQHGTARSACLKLESFLFEETIRRELGAKRGVLVPDAVAVLSGCEGRRLALAVEIDQGSETPRFVAERKALPYAALRQGGAPLRGCAEWRVACITTSEARRNRLISALWEANVPEGLWFFSTRDALSDETVLDSAWVTPRLRADGGSAQLVVESPLQGVITACNNGCDRRSARSAAVSEELAPAAQRE